MSVFFQAFCIHANTTSAEYQNRDFHLAHYLFLPHVYDFDDLAMAYQYLSCISRVFRNASCTYIHSSIQSFSLNQLFKQIVTRVLLNKATYTDSVNQTPYFAGIIFASILWVVFCWLTRLIQRMSAFSFWFITKSSKTSQQKRNLMPSHTLYLHWLLVCAHTISSAL